jgi:hypothetical protein
MARNGRAPHPRAAPPRPAVRRTSRSFEQLWRDKQHALQLPDVLVLAGGTQLLYRTADGGWQRDEQWATELASDPAWDATAARAAALRVAASTPAGGPNGDPSSPSGPRSLRVKLDDAKQQTPLRVRLLVRGTVEQAEAVASALLLEAVSGHEGGWQAGARGGGGGQQSEPSSSAPAAGGHAGREQQQQQQQGEHGEQGEQRRRRRRGQQLWPRWRALVHARAEGGGAAHAGWCAVDLVPWRAGESLALAHVWRRFRLDPGEHVAVVSDARKDAGAMLAAGRGAVLPSSALREPALARWAAAAAHGAHGSTLGSTGGGGWGCGERGEAAAAAEAPRPHQAQQQKERAMPAGGQGQQRARRGAAAAAAVAAAVAGARGDGGCAGAERPPRVVLSSRWGPASLLDGLARLGELPRLAGDGERSEGY